MKNIIQINETELKRLLKECVQQVLLEIDHRETTTPIIHNMNAQDEMARGNSGDSSTSSFFKQRTDTSSEIYNQITQGVKDNIGDNLRLTFGRRELDRSTSTVEFFFEEVLLLTPKRAVIQGRVNESRSPISIGKRKPKHIQIDYHFEDQCFYEAVYCANGTVRDLKQLTLDYAEDETNRNLTTAINLIKFLTMCLYSIDDGETTINQKKSSQSYKRIPFK